MKLGCDPEVFLKDVKTGKFISVIGKVGGNKQFPLQIPHLPKGFTLQEDNVAMEFGIPPATSSTKFVEYINKVMQEGLSTVPGTFFSNLSCVEFPEQELKHPLANVFGCEPDYNAWTGEVNEKPLASNPALRSAGGHVHVATNLDKNKVVQAMDLFLGIPSLLMDENGEERRQLYGKAGACRYKPYGVEHRVLSNFWIFHEKLIKWVWRETARALKFVESGQEVPTAVEYIINNSDYDLATLFIKEHKLSVLYP